MRTLVAAAVMLAAAGQCGAEEIAPGDVAFTEADDVVTVTTPLTDTPGDGYRGVQLFMAEDGGNCLGCHENYDTAATGRAGDVGPNLSLVGDKHAEGWFRALLVDAHSVFGEETLMPQFYVADDQGETLLSAQEIEDIVAYLMELHAYGN